MPRGGIYVKFKNYERKTKSLFIIFADFESILVPENSDESYTNKCQKHVLCSYGSTLMINLVNLLNLT